MKRYYLFAFPFIIFAVASCSYRIKTHGHILIEYAKDNADFPVFIKTLSDGRVYIHKKNEIPFVVLENSQVVYKNETGYIIEDGAVIYNSKSNSRINIDHQILFSETNGGAQFLKIILPLRYRDMTADAKIIYHEENREIEIEGRLYQVVQNKKSIVYGMFIPLSYIYNPDTYSVHIDFFEKGKKWGSFVKTFPVVEKEWETQVIYFKRAKSKELAEADKNTYREEHEVRKEIWKTVTQSSFLEAGYMTPLADYRFMTSDFGLRREWRFYNGKLYSRSIHMGVDYGQHKGTPVLAAASGIIRYAQKGELVGNTIIIDHGLSLFTDYSHLDTIEVEVGQVVEKGQRIGTVGMTGAATGPHLHWGARIYVLPIDPRTFYGTEQIFTIP